MTNGEKLKEVFPSIELYEKSHNAIQINFNSVWWNAEYQEPSSSEKPNKSGIPTGSNDCISRADALRVAKNEYLRGWHNALCKALREKYSIHCEEGNFSVIQEETITGLGLSMNCAVGKDVEGYMSTIPSVKTIRPKGHWIMTSDYLTTAYGSVDYVKCSCCGEDSLEEGDYCPNCGADMRGDAE